MTAGRPLTYNTTEELQKNIDEFFIWCEVNDKVPLQGELIYFLGFSGRQSLTDYQKRDEFSYIIERAKQRCENELNQAGLKNKLNANLVKLNLSSNYGFNEKTEVDVKTVDPISLVVNGVKAE
jgi:hypothetical protein